jgi:RNA polymerase sigma-70 factor (ECF subfamily)
LNSERNRCKVKPTYRVKRSGRVIFTLLGSRGHQEALFDLSGKNLMNSISQNADTWLDAHGDALFAYAVSRLHSREEAEDVVQDAFVAALSKYEQLEGEPGPWLMGILKRKVIDRQRRKKLTVSSSHQESAVEDWFFDQKGKWSNNVSSTQSVRLDKLEAEEFLDYFKRCFAKLPASYADVFQRREVCEDSTENICKELDLTPSNLWVIMYRARLRLAECLKRHWGGLED